MESLLFQLLILLLTISSSTMANNKSQPKDPTGLASLREGDSLTVEKWNETFLASPNGTFAAGFRRVGTNAFYFSVWFANSEEHTAAWTANRDSPVNGRGSRLTVTRRGNMVLTDLSGQTVWSTHSSSGSRLEARLLETGNLVLFDTESRVSVWESFGFPTDTLVPTQRLVKNTSLVSARTRGSSLTGLYNLKFDDNNVLNLIYNGPELSSIYWPRQQGGGSVFETGRTPYNSSRVASLDPFGEFLSSDLLEFRAFDYGDYKRARRLTLDSDGVLRLYSLDEATGSWVVTWVPNLFDSCRVDGICGEYGICGYGYGSVSPECSCPDRGFQRNDLSDWSRGCRPLFDLSNGSVRFDFLKLLNTDYYGYDLSTFKFGISLGDCRNICLTDPLCKGFGYSSDGLGQCFPKSFLTNGYRMPSSQSVMYIKVPRSSMTTAISGSDRPENGLSCSGSEIFIGNGDGAGEKRDGDGYVKYMAAFVAAFGVIEAVFLGVWWWFMYRIGVNEEVVNMGYIAVAMGFKRFTYAELKRATRNFKEEIGKGGFGSVYKGVLEDGRVIAVKRLEGVVQGSSEFWAEVSVIGNINHRNLVKLWGFCADDHKLLVYEHVENGSLDKILFSDDPSNALGLEKRYNIALGTAKGLSYLHEECLEWVLHCDVKPQNILLDENLEPKVSDFGMSKLFKNAHENDGDRGFSRVRGTRGYLAPEWTMNLMIDAKADVYSYGIVVLELLSGKCVAESLSAAASGDGEFNHWVHWMREKIGRGEFEDVIDLRLVDRQGFDRRKVERMVKVALLCVQDDRSSRPAMSKVVEILLETD